MRPALWLSGAFLLVLPMREAASQRRATDVEQQVIELSVITGMRDRPNGDLIFSRPAGLHLDPRLFIDLPGRPVPLPGIRTPAWQLRWDLDLGERRREMQPSHTFDHMSRLSAAAGVPVLANVSACVGTSQCDADTLPRLFFSPAVVHGDSAQIRFYRAVTWHDGPRPELARLEDRRTEIGTWHVLLIRDGATWRIVLAPHTPPASVAR